MYGREATDCAIGSLHENESLVTKVQENLTLMVIRCHVAQQLMLQVLKFPDTYGVQCEIAQERFIPNAFLERMLFDRRSRLQPELEIGANFLHKFNYVSNQCHSCNPINFSIAAAIASQTKNVAS